MTSNVTALYVPTGGGNVILRKDGFSISFNADPGQGISFYAGDTEDGETAIVVDDSFFILNADFRKEYAELSLQGLVPCLKFFMQHPDLVSSWSASVADAAAMCDGWESAGVTVSGQLANVLEQTDGR